MVHSLAAAAAFALSVISCSLNNVSGIDVHFFGYIVSSQNQTEPNRTENENKFQWNLNEMKWKEATSATTTTNNRFTHMYWPGMHSNFCQKSHQVQMNWVLMLMLWLSSSTSVLLLLCVEFCCLKSFPLRWIVQSADFLLRFRVLFFFCRSLSV